MNKVASAGYLPNGSLGRSDFSLEHIETTPRAVLESIALESPYRPFSPQIQLPNMMGFCSPEQHVHQILGNPLFAQPLLEESPTATRDVAPVGTWHSRIFNSHGLDASQTNPKPPPALAGRASMTKGREGEEVVMAEGPIPREHPKDRAYDTEYLPIDGINLRKAGLFFCVTR